MHTTGGDTMRADSTTELDRRFLYDSWESSGLPTLGESLRESVERFGAAAERRWMPTLYQRLGTILGSIVCAAHPACVTI
jgi:hypothetical protein